MRKTFAVIATFLFVRFVVQASRKHITTTREKQNPINMACGINVFLDNLKKKIAWTIPSPKYTAKSTAAAGISAGQLRFSKSGEVYQLHRRGFRQLDKLTYCVYKLEWNGFQLFVVWSLFIL